MEANYVQDAKLLYCRSRCAAGDLPQSGGSPAHAGHGEAETVNQAVQLTGISRSAFYKYRDAVRPFQDMLHGRIVTFQIMMKDEPGILSQVLNFFADSGANILTINQGLPINGCAVVTVNAETSGLRGSLQELLAQLNEAEGVLRGEILAG